MYKSVLIIYMKFIWFYLWTVIKVKLQVKTLMKLYIPPEFYYLNTVILNSCLGCTFVPRINAKIKQNGDMLRHVIAYSYS